MGMFKQHVRVSNIYHQEFFFESEFWVDTGALYSFIPNNFLVKIKVEPQDTKNLIFADGRTDKRLFGYCNFKIQELKNSKPAICPVIFAPENSLFLLGATALENFGVDADTVNKQLKPIAAIIGGFGGSI